MKQHLILFRAMTAWGVMALAPSLSAVTNIWTGASGPDLQWLTPGNWLPSGPPGTNDETRFFDAGATNDITLISSVISANTTIHSLVFGQTNGYHNLFINPGITLTVRGTNDNGFGPLGSDPASTAPNPVVQSTLYVGRLANISDILNGSNSISGLSGTLVLNNTNNELNVRAISGDNGATPPVLHGGGNRRAILDMSGLGTFTANLGRIRIGDGEANPIRRAEGQVLLARTNTITLTGTNYQDNVQLVIGNNDVNNNGGGTSFLILGQKNTINVDRILVGGRKTPGNISFNANITSPTLQLRGSDGSGRVAALRIGDQSDQSASGNTTIGTVNLSGGMADIAADRVIIATSQSSAGSAGTGTLTLGTGTLDANSIELASQLAANITVAVTGNLNVNSNAVTVNNLLRMGRSSGGSGAINANLNLNGGSVTVRSNFVTQGTAAINITNGTLALTTQASVLASVVNLDGGTISNAASLRVTNTFNVVNGGVILGSPTFDMGNSGLATWNLEGVTGAGLTVSNTFQGGGTYLGNLIQAPGATLNPGGSSAVGTLAVQTAGAGGNVVLNNNGTLLFDLSSSGLSGNDQLTVSGNLTLNGTNNVILTSLGGSLDTANPYTLITAGTVSGNQNNFRMAGALAQSRYIFTFDTTSTPNSVKLLVSGTGAANLTWVGDGSANLWNTKGAANWTSGSPSQFFSLDSVTFNDTGSATPSVSLVGSLIPGSITMNNPTKSYTFTGTGGLTAGGGLTKIGAGSLTLSNTGDNSFSGAVTISNGAVTFSNNGLNTFAGGLAVNGGSLTLSGGSTNTLTALSTVNIASGASLTVANTNVNTFNDATFQLDGTLTINQPVDGSVNGAISGAGTLTKSGTGTLSLGANNAALTSVIQVNAGTLKAGLAGSLGGGGVTVASGAKLNLTGFSFNSLPVIASGQGPDGSGAVVNTAAPQANALGNLTLAGDTTFGGSGPWSTDPVLNSGMWAVVGNLSTSTQARNLTKTGLNEVIINNTTVDAALADIDVQQGLLSFNGTTDSMGNPARTLTVRAGATLGLSATTTLWDKKLVLFGNGAAPSLFNYNGANTLVGSVVLNGNCVISAAPPDRGNPVSLTLNGVISGSGGLSKPSKDMLILGGTNTYTGDTTVNAGTLALSGGGSIATSSNVTLAAGASLDASQRTDGTFTLTSGQTLRGNGAINGIFIASTGSTVLPGTSIGSLSITGAVTLRGTVFMELNGVAATNDVISSSTSITLNGAIISVTNVAGTLSNGASFKLLDAPAGQISGTFTIQPATPGPGQTWNTASLAVDGTLKVSGNGSAGQPKIGGINLSGGNVIFSGSGGTPNGDYYVLTSTNVTSPLASWTRLVTNKFDASGNFNVTNAVSPSTPQLFYLLQTP